MLAASMAGGLFGKKKKKSSNTTYSSPWGTFRTRGNRSTWTPNWDANQREQIGVRNARLNQATKSLPSAFSVQDMYNNPFYNDSEQLFNAPVLRQYAEDTSSLDNELNSRNQIGSSYDALRRMYLMRDRDFNLNQGRLQARQASSDAYNQSISNALQVMAGLRNDEVSQIQGQAIPMQAGLNMAQQNNALQLARMSNEAQRQQSQNQSNQAMMQSALAALSLLCWVAREVYGEHNPKWLQVRSWMLNEAPEDLRSFYIEKGPVIAMKIRDDEEAKAEIRGIMNDIIGVAE